MSDRVVIVGSRFGADHDALIHFVRRLYTKYPDTILVSGGAVGVDATAEMTWLGEGGQVESFRPTKVGEEHYVIEKWELGGEHPRVFRLVEELSFANYKSAALYRDILIAEIADRTVVFFRAGRSRGAGFTAEMTETCYGKPVYKYEASNG